MRTQKRILIPILAACLIALGVSFFSDPVYAQKISSLSQAAKLASKDVKNADITEVDRDYKNGQLVYEVTLIKNTKEYEITYRASDGKKLSYGWEEYAFKKHSAKKALHKKKIQDLALKKVPGATIKSIVQKYDDGVLVYKVKLIQGSKDHTLKYHAKTGKLLEYEWKIRSSSQKPVENNPYIGIEKAKNTALAKVPNATIVKAEFDMDDGIPIYEIELIKGAMEYDIKIHARSGKILEIDRDYNDDYWW